MNLSRGSGKVAVEVSKVRVVPVRLATGSVNSIIVKVSDDKR